MQNQSPNQQRRRPYFNQTFQSSLIDSGPQKFTLQKSVIRGIKENNVGKIVDIGQQGDLQDKQRLYDQTGQASVGVISIRTKYDNLKTQTNRLANNIQTIKGKIELLKADQAKYQNIHEDQKNNLDSVKSQLSGVTVTMEDSVYQKDVYNQMYQNLKKDIIILKKRYFDMDIVFHRDKTKLKSLRNQAFTKKKLGQNCLKMLQDVQKTVNQKQRQRSTKINSFHQVLSKKQQNVRRKSERQRQVQQVMIMAMTQKSQQERQWINIFNTNKFLKAMLKLKMERLMEKYGTIEKAFQTIKLQTGVWHSDDFIQRFLNKEKTYGILLESISDKEDKLNNLKAENEMLTNDHQQLIQKMQQIDQMHKKISLIPENLQKKMDHYSSQVMLIQRQRVSMYQWSIKNLSILLGLQRKDSLYKKYSRKQNKQNLKKCFIDSLTNIKQFLQNLQKQAGYQKKIENAYQNQASNFQPSSLKKQRCMTQQAQFRNIRVKTVQTGDFQNEEGNNEFQDHDMAYDDISQIDYLNHYRRAIKKNDQQSKRFRIKTKPN